MNFLGKNKSKPTKWCTLAEILSGHLRICVINFNIEFSAAYFVIKRVSFNTSDCKCKCMEQKLH